MIMRCVYMFEKNTGICISYIHRMLHLDLMLLSGHLIEMCLRARSVRKQSLMPRCVLKDLDAIIAKHVARLKVMCITKVH